MKKLVAAGTDTEKDLAAAQADLIQAQIQGRKDVHEADTAVRLAQRTEAALARQLQQAGLEPDLLRSMTWDVDVVMADVPEGLMSRVKLGQGCEARFFGLPEQLFPRQGTGDCAGAFQGAPLAAGLVRHQRSRTISFAPACSPTSAWAPIVRDALLVPAEAVVHVGRTDYVFVHDGTRLARDRGAGRRSPQMSAGSARRPAGRRPDCRPRA